ncbi:uncharacterized protein N7511_005502 [Penicillium nucicola]|uniref:uncharacterized protein n=1 Tax=Penicillium nucicola TaxID=1850975 RepID=UPI002544E8F0|nr:uncharacterized protein N7511_005502 [Penicillium nucicola]KAJ5762120.1 hypothetical protein N7511_005502 [Penicillium nucicola]
MAHNIHVAVLDADIPCLSVYQERGLYSSQFRTLLQAAATRLNKSADTSLQYGPLAVHVTAFDAVGRTLPPLSTLRNSPKTTAEPQSGSPLTLIDAILITGSASSAYEDLPWIHELQAFIQTVHADYPHVKIFGSCFGHQIIAQALLCKEQTSLQSSFHVANDQAGFEMGIQPIILDPEFTARFPPLERASRLNPFRIQLVHGDRVVPTPEAIAAAMAAGNTDVSLPAPWSNIGSSAQCAIQGLYNPGRVLSYQGHFEFDTFVNAELSREFGRRANWPVEVVAGFLQLINRSFVPEMDDNDDSKAAAEAVLLFFAGEDLKGQGVGLGLPGSGLLTPPLG